MWLRGTSVPTFSQILAVQAPVSDFLQRLQLERTSGPVHSTYMYTFTHILFQLVTRRNMETDLLEY